MDFGLLWGMTLFWGAPKSLQIVTIAMKLKDVYSLEGKLCQPRQQIKKQSHNEVSLHASQDGCYPKVYKQ